MRTGKTKELAPLSGKWKCGEITVIVAKDGRTATFSCAHLPKVFSRMRKVKKTYQSVRAVRIIIGRLKRHDRPYVESLVRRIQIDMLRASRASSLI